VINEFGKSVVPAADRHVLRQRGEVGVGRLAIIKVGPHLVILHGEDIGLEEPHVAPNPLVIRGRALDGGV
jgi:hypothetical protein